MESFEQCCKTMSLQVPTGGGGVQPHRLDSDEICIREAIRKYYVFIHRVDTLRDEIGQLGNIDEQTRLRVLDQLDDIESELHSVREGGVASICTVATGFGDLTD